MLLSSEGETRDDFHYSILKTDKSKAPKQIFWKATRKYHWFYRELGAVYYWCVGNFPHLSLKWLLYTALLVFSCCSVRTTRPAPIQLHWLLKYSLEISIICINFLKTYLTDHTSTLEPLGFGRCSPWALYMSQTGTFPYIYVRANTLKTFNTKLYITRSRTLKIILKCRYRENACRDEPVEIQSLWDI